MFLAMFFLIFFSTEAWKARISFEMTISHSHASKNMPYNYSQPLLHRESDRLYGLGLEWNKFGNVATPKHIMIRAHTELEEALSLIHSTAPNELI